MKYLVFVLMASACVCEPAPSGFCAAVDALGCGIDTATCREPTPDPTDCDIPDPEACLDALYAAETCEAALAAAGSQVCAEVCGL